MRLEVVTIGDELLLGHTIDTNAAHLARELAGIGVSIVRRATVGDAAEEIAAGVRDALDRADGVITTGGLGPTSDDLTKESVAALFGRRMILDERILADLEQRWADRFGGPLPASNRQQAMVPEGATILVNRHGSAPGIWLENERDRWVAMLPGVPREMRGMLADELLPRLAGRVGEDPTVVRSAVLRTTSVAESALADRLGPLARGIGTLSLAYLPGQEGVDLRLTSRGARAADADVALTAGVAALRGSVGANAYAEGQVDLAAVVLDLCRTRGLTIAVAESCTGGLLGARLTAIAGSSDVVLGGVIAYDDHVKSGLLGVSPADIATHGAVSEAVARQLASGARARLGADVGIGITGVAGPGGGTAEKPVGTVWIAVDVRGVAEGHHGRYIGDREEIRFRATQRALDLLRRRLDD